MITITLTERMIMITRIHMVTDTITTMTTGMVMKETTWKSC